MDVRLKHIDGTEQHLYLAGIGARAYAFLCDWIIRASLVALVYWGLFSDAPVSLTEELLGFIKQHNPLSWDVWVLVAIWVLYYPLQEWLWSGKTLGKQIAGLQVVTQKGGPPSFMAAILRQIGRLVDMVPGTYTVGLLFCLFTNRQMRFGDMVSGTWVVYSSAAAEPVAAMVPSKVMVLDPEKQQYLEELIDRWQNMPLDRRCKLGKAFLDSVSVTPPMGVIDENFDKILYTRLVALFKNT